MRYIYALICPIQGIKYIGQTKRELIQRLNSHIYEYRRIKKTSKKYNSHKYNWLASLEKEDRLKDLKIILIEQCEESEVNDREIFWIKYHINSNLTNASHGGGNHSQETIEKIRATKIGKLNPRFGIPISPEHRSRMLEGMRHSIKFKESRKSEEYKKKISDHFSIPLVVLTEELKIHSKYKNATECAKAFGYKKANILHAVRDKRKIGRKGKEKYWILREEEYKI